MRQFQAPAARTTPAGGTDIPSALGHWPIQLHLANPHAPHYQGADLLLAADCTAFTIGAFHGKLLAGKSLAIACPKLDENQDAYVEKLAAMIDGAAINTLTVAIMEVPCCGGLLRLAETARAKASRVVPLRLVVVGLEGGILKDEWVR
jgi:hypothetical protein